MFSNKVSSKRSPLAPQRELQLINIYLEQGRTASKKGEHEIALVLCEEADASLSKMKKCVKAAEVRDVTDLRRGVACAFLELSQLLEELNQHERAKDSGSKANDWGYVEVEKLSVVTQSALYKLATVDVDKSIDGDFFTQDRAPPVIEYKLPEPDERLVSTHQLVYCLGLLKDPPSLDGPHRDSALQWVKATQANQDELERLNTLTMNLVRVFIRDDMKSPTAIAEVACIAPFLNRTDFRRLLELFISSIANSTLLDINSLEGLAKLVQGANEDYLEAADLVSILEVLNTRLQTTHKQTQDYIYQLMWAVSRVLDAMADCKVEGLDRVALHGCLAGYINNLKGSADPHMVYLAAYAYQSLECVPDNESPWQATKRRTGEVMQGAFGLVKAAKGLDVYSFLEGIQHIEDGLDGAVKAFQTLRDGYDNVVALRDSGQGLLIALKDGLSLNHKRSWYSTLRGLDRMLRDGQLSKFRTLVLAAPCRRSLAFQWGLCQRLGDLAANPAWDPKSCEEALEFLAEIYQNDAEWGYHVHVKQKILDILLHLQQQPENAIQAFDSIIAEKVLQRLGHNGDKAKQTLYSDCLTLGASKYPLKISQPQFTTLTLLDRVQNKPDVEEDLRKLRQRRLKERGNAVYIPPRAKANLKASDNVLFDLTEKVEEFLASGDQKVLLLLGDSGSGKSTFNHQIEHSLWQKYEKIKGRIPLFINLAAIERPEHDMIVKQLRKFELSDPQIRELKAYREFVLICDGYDESQEKHNLYTSNRLNQTGEWQVQMVVSCRSEYIGLDYHDYFQPSNDITQFQEAVIAPFSRLQVDDYVEKYVITKTPLWTTTQYKEVLDQIHSLQELVKNPFLLTLSLEVLPRLVDLESSIKATRVSRVILYDEFVVLWLEQGKKRLGNKDLDRQERADFDRLIDEGFTQNGISFLTDMAKAIYKNQAGNPVVTYSRKRDQGTWKEAFFSRDNESQLLLEASPLTRSGIQYRFIHKSLLEYFFSRSVFEPQEGKEKSVQDAAPARRGSVSSNFSFDDDLMPVEEEEPAPTQPLAVDHPLSWRSFVTEPSVLDFLSDRVQQEPLFKDQLLAMLEQSKVNKEMRKAAANAITILVRAGVQFIGADLQHIQIPGADLSLGVFDSAQLQGADLRKTRLRHIWLRNADLSYANMEGVDFGQIILVQRSGVQCCAYSPDGTLCVVGLCNNEIKLHSTKTWKEVHTLQGHEDMVATVVYSPDGKQIASGSDDKTVRLWDPLQNSAIWVFCGHTGRVECVVYSPKGDLIASCSSDKTVRIWNPETLQLAHLLIGHDNYVMSVVFSPSGKYVASGSYDNMVRIWSAHDGDHLRTLSQHASCVKSVVYSPDGKHIASASYDKTVRIWDSASGELLQVLQHKDMVTSMAYSPNGLQIAAGSGSHVQLWDSKSGTESHLLTGHADGIISVVYSPSGHQIASSCYDKTVRLWDTQSGAPQQTIIGHVNNIMSIVYAPNGQQLATASLDKSVRFWDSQTGLSVETSNSHTDRVNSVTYSPKGCTLASGGFDKTLRLWNAKTGVLIKTFGDHVNQTTTSNANQTAEFKVGRIARAVYSPIGGQIALGSDDMCVYIWNTQTGTPVHKLLGHIDCVTSVAYSPKGLFLASGSDDCTVRHWDVEKGTIVRELKGHGGCVSDVAYSPCGNQIASGSFDKTVILWRADSGMVVERLFGHTKIVTSVVYSPDGQWIASGSNDKTVRLWESTGEFKFELKGHTDRVRSVVFSPSSQEIASGSLDSSVNLWEVGSGQLLITVEATPIRSLAWVKNDYDGNDIDSFLAAGSDDKSVRVWSVRRTESKPAVQLHWSSTHNQLVLSGAKLSRTQGLSDFNKTVMTQYGAKGISTVEQQRRPQAMTLRTSSERVASINTAVAQMQKAGNRRELDVPYIDDALPYPPSEPMEFS